MDGLIFYEDFQSGNCYKIMLIVVLFGLLFEYRCYDIFKGEMCMFEFFVMINVNGCILVLQIGSGDVVCFLFESNVVCWYLVEGSLFVFGSCF